MENGHRHVNCPVCGEKIDGVPFSWDTCSKECARVFHQTEWNYRVTKELIEALRPVEAPK